MRILHITGSVSRKAGGVLYSVCRFSQEQVAQGCDVEVVGLEDEFSTSDAHLWAPVKPHVMPVKRPVSWGYAPGLRAKLDELKPDIVHLHGLWMYNSVMLSGWAGAAGIKYVVSPHGMLDAWALRNSSWKKKIAGMLYEKRNLNSADCVHALTTKEANDIKAYGIGSDICVVPNGVDVPEDRRKVPRSKFNEGMRAGEVQGSRLRGQMYGDHESGRNKILLYIGRLHPKKGLESLLQAWALAGDQVSSAGAWRLMIAGWDDGGHEQRLRSMVAELGLENEVSFAGPVYGDVKDELLRKANAFILPSLSEGLPVSVLEAWAYGLPVLMTRECNLPDGFEAGAAIEVEPGRDGVLHGLTRLALMSEEDMMAMGRRGRKLVEDNYSWGDVTGRMIAVYKRIISG